MGLSSVIGTLHGVHAQVRTRWCGAGPTRACRGDVDAGVDVASSEAAAAVKMVLLVATNIMQAFDGPDGRYSGSVVSEALLNRSWLRKCSLPQLTHRSGSAEL